tara:strand:- start:4398 stop:5576 length:1179 start_codon:yes stop_codon:yes gene_type:complete
MVAKTYIGENRALVFPVMCDGYIKIKYNDFHITTELTDLRNRYGFWGHQKSFTIESIVTPYDVNGYGTVSGSGSNHIGNTTSIKTIPALSQTYHLSSGGGGSSPVQAYSQSETYLCTQDTTLAPSRFSQKMYIFKNSTCEVYLENTSLNNYNQPAEYKIVFKLQATDGTSTTMTTLESSDLFLGSNRLYGEYDEHGYYNADASTSLTKILNGSTPVTISSSTSTTLVLSAALTSLDVGSEIFNASGVSLGTITTLSSNRLTLTFAADPRTNTSNGENLLTYQPKECLYLEGSYHIAVTFNIQGQMCIFINGVKVATKQHGITSNLEFYFEPEDCYIGQDASLGTAALRRGTQFMGELHEFAISKGTTTKFSSLETLSPSIDNLLLYYRFGGD